MTRNNYKIYYRDYLTGIILVISFLLFFRCSSDTKTETTPEIPETNQTVAQQVDEGKGTGPIKLVELQPDIDVALAAKGKTIFEQKCTACHKADAEKLIGPGLKDITTRHKPEWIMNMIMNPEIMTRRDPVAKKLLQEHTTQMTDQNIKEPEARALLEYLRQNDMETDSVAVN